MSFVKQHGTIRKLPPATFIDSAVSAFEADLKIGDLLDAERNVRVTELSSI